MEMSATQVTRTETVLHTDDVRMSVDATGVVGVLVPTAEGGTVRLVPTATAHDHLARSAHVPQGYYRRMLAELPTLAADTLEAWWAHEPQNQRVVYDGEGRLHAWVPEDWMLATATGVDRMASAAAKAHGHPTPGVWARCYDEGRDTHHTIYMMDHDAGVGVYVGASPTATTAPTVVALVFIGDERVYGSPVPMGAADGLADMVRLAAHPRHREAVHANLRTEHRHRRLGGPVHMALREAVGEGLADVVLCRIQDGAKGALALTQARLAEEAARYAMEAAQRAHEGGPCHAATTAATAAGHAGRLLMAPVSELGLRAEGGA